jgi:hypothetical protein
MTIAAILISVGVAVWMAFMVLAIVLPVNPKLLKLTEKIVCPAGSELIIHKAVYSYHRPGQSALEISIRDKTGMSKSAGFKVVAVFWMILFLASLPISFFTIMQVIIRLPM